MSNRKGPEFKTRIGVDGEETYKQALSNVSRSLGVLRAEMKATDSAFGANKDSIEALTAKQQALTAQQEKHAEKVKLLKEMLEIAKNEFGENSKEADDYRIKVARAETALNGVNNELGSVKDKLNVAQNAQEALTDSTEKLDTAADGAAEAVKDEGEKADDASQKNTALSDAMSAAGSVAAGAMSAGIAAAAAAIAALATAAAAGTKEMISLGTESIQATNQMAAQTGAEGAELEALGEIAKNVYGDNFGESIGDVNEALSVTKTNTGLVGHALEDATKYGLMMRDTFGMDIQESSRASASLMKTFGLNAQDAYNLIAVGAQKGANQNGDMLDVLSEYGPMYKQMGFDADDMMQSLIGGAENGVFSIDKVGDAMKEFSIRAKDGSDGTKEAFKAIGLNADEMGAAFAQGGPKAKQAFGQVVAGLNAIEDPMKRNQVAVALFGTQYEDLGPQVLGILGSMTEGGELAADALEKINEVRCDDLDSALEGVKRTIETQLLPVSQAMSAALTAALNEIGATLSDGFQPDDIRVIGETIAGTLMQGISELGVMIEEYAPLLTETMTTMVGVLAEALPALADALLPAALGLLQSIVTAITANVEPLTTLAATLVTVLAGFIIENAPEMVGAATDLLTGLITGIGEGLPALLPAALGMVLEIVTGLVAALPLMLEAGGSILTNLTEGITGALPTLVEALPEIITAVTTAITTALPDILAQGAEILTSLIQGITDTIPTLVEKMPEIITAVTTAITTALPDILAQGTAILTSLIQGIGDAIPTLVEAMPAVVSAIVSGITAVDWLDLGKNLIQGLIDGLAAAVTALGESIKAIWSSIWDTALDFFGIHSPSTLAAEAGGFILDGLVAGLQAGVEAVCTAVKAIFGTIWDAIKSVFGFGDKDSENQEAQAAGQDIMTGIKDGVTGNEEAVKTAIETTAQGILSSLETELGVAEGASSKTRIMGANLTKGITAGMQDVTAETFQEAAGLIAEAVTTAISMAFGVESTGFLGMGGEVAQPFKNIGAAVCKGIAQGISSSEADIEAVKTAIMGVAQAAYQQAVAETAAGLTDSEESVDQAVQLVADSALLAMEEILTEAEGQTIGETFTGGVTLGIETQKRGLLKETTMAGTAAVYMLSTVLSWEQGGAIGTAFAHGTADGIRRNAGQAADAAASVARAAKAALSAAVSDGGAFEEIGRAIAAGVARGIRQGRAGVASAAASIAHAAHGAARRELDINSPSRVMEEVGLMYDAGFARGIARGMQGITDEVNRVSGLAAVGAVPRGGYGMQDGGIDYERLADAMTDSMTRAGVGRSDMIVNGRKLGETVAPDAGRKIRDDGMMTAAGRAARLVTI